MNAARMRAEWIGRLLGQFSYRYTSEAQLHDRVAEVLRDNAVAFERERRSDEKNRFDFFCDGGVVIEIKVDGSVSSALRQIVRYSALDEVQAILLASTQRWGSRPLAKSIRNDGWHGNPFALTRLHRQVL